MSTTVEELERWMSLPSKTEHVEFKEAKNQFDSTRLLKYCVALANEGGGRLILGVSDKRPRQVVGSQAFLNVEEVKGRLLEALRVRVEVETIAHPQGRVVIFHVPSRPVGMPVHLDGQYLMRAGEQLVAMTPDMLRRISTRAGPTSSRRPRPPACRPTTWCACWTPRGTSTSSRCITRPSAPACWSASRARG